MDALKKEEIKRTSIVNIKSTENRPMSKQNLLLEDLEYGETEKEQRNAAQNMEKKKRAEATNSSQGEELDLLRLFSEYLIHWRSFIVILVISLAIGIGLAILKDSGTYEIKTKEEQMQYQALIYKYEQYLENTEKRSNGYLMTLAEGTDYYYGTDVYYIKADDVNTTRLLGSLMDVTNSSQYVYDLQSLLQVKENIPVNSLSSLFHYSFDLYDDTSSIAFTTTEKYEKDTEYYGIITCSYAYLTEEQLAIVKKYAKDSLNERYNQYKDFYSKFQFTKVEEHTFPYTMDIRLSAQNAVNNENLGEWNDFLKYIDTLGDTDTKTETWVNEDIHYKKLAEKFKEEYLGLVRDSHLIKYAVIMTMLGILAWVVVNTIKFLLAGKIYSENELWEQYGLHTIGILPEKKRKRGLDKLPSKLSGDDKKLYSTEEYLGECLDLFKKGQMTLCVLGDEVSLYMKANLIKLKSTCACRVGNLCTDKKTLAYAVKSCAVVFVVALGESTRKELKASLDICDAYDIEPLGVICINRNA